MKLAHFCTFPHGGAATAAMRQHQTCLEQGWDSRFYFHRDQSDSELQGNRDSTIHQIEFPIPDLSGVTKTLARRNLKVRQKRIFELYNRHLAVRPPLGDTFAMAELPDASPLDWSGIDADLVHLHWISYFADYPSFFASIPDSVPIVWSLHDTNAFTGGCHYTGGCGRYAFGCGSCPQVSASGPNDVSRHSFAAKQKSLRKKSIHVVAPCDWMLDLAKRSPVWPAGTTFHKIEYGLDVDQFYPIDQSLARQQLGLPCDKRLIAFGAMDIQNPRKGFQHLLPALGHLAQGRQNHDIECIVFGSGKIESGESLPPMHELGFLDSVDRQRLVYSAADLVVVPSTEDNQPQVGLEAMACGTPVVAFDSCGMPEYVIPEKSGALAVAGDETDLASKIRAMLESPEQCATLGRSARSLIQSRFEKNRQAACWMTLYADALGQRPQTQRRAA